MNTKKEFGFYPHPLCIEEGPITVSPLSDLEQSAKDVLACNSVEKDWFYAPHQQISEVMSGKVRDLPYSSRVFGLPKTHWIEHDAATGENHLDFILWVLSFFVGMRLTPDEAGFLDATPLKPGKLVGFILLGSSHSHAVRLADDFWLENINDPRRAQRFVAAVHALFLSQNPQLLQFERFVYLYMAIDACYSLAASLFPPQKTCRHYRRIEWMCNQFNVVTPAWANPAAPGGVKVSAIRNNTIHEALYMGGPLGFEIYTECNLVLQMQALVCRLLVALIGGIGLAYVRSPVTDRQIQGLDLKGI
ncbi:MAG: hypothetical protein OXB98_01020 [Bryobacterales bacterium]|nr:hypothetical protein [Bryobacterales bacterium]